MNYWHPISSRSTSCVRASSSKPNRQVVYFHSTRFEPKTMNFCQSHGKLWSKMSQDHFWRFVHSKLVWGRTLAMEVDESNVVKAIGDETFSSMKTSSYSRFISGLKISNGQKRIYLRLSLAKPFHYNLQAPYSWFNVQESVSIGLTLIIY